MKNENSKLRPFALIQLLIQHSSDEHPLSMPEILAALESQGILCERKTIYDDFKVLEQIGLTVEFVRTPKMGYVLSERIFDSVELKLLMDAVSSAAFLSKKKTAHIQQKLLKFASSEEKESLAPLIEYPKSSNEQIFYLIDVLLKAIREKKKITFTYFDLGLDKKRHYRRNKRLYQGDPYGLLWENKVYYLLFKMDGHDEISQYRVDKMDQLVCTSITYEQIPFDINQYRSERINMYSGEKVNLTLKVKNSERLASLLYEQFGEELLVLSQDDHEFLINVNTSISPTLMGWLTTLGTQVTIVKPQSLIDAYHDYLNNILNNYQEVTDDTD